MSDELVELTDIPFVEDSSPIVIDYNRPIVEIPWVPPPPKQPEPEPPHWTECSPEGLKSFNYMISRFEEMFESESTIKEFYVNPLNEAFYGSHDEFNDIYNKEIQKQLIIWLRKELADNRLFDVNYWKPFEDRVYMRTMYMGYKQMFMFNNYYFQLIISAAEDVEYCFELIYHYGLSSLPDDMMPSNYWNSKY